MHVIEPNACYSAEEVCEVLGVGRTTLQRYFHKGLVARKPRGKVHILGSDLLDFLKADHNDDKPQYIPRKLENRIAKAVLDIRKGKTPIPQVVGGQE